MSDFSINVKKFRKDKNMTQVELAQAMEVAQSVVANWERGKINPSIESALKLSKIFSVSLDELFSNTNILNTRKNISEEYNTSISDEENELLTTFRKLSIRNKVKTLDFVLELAESSRGGNSSSSRIS